VVCAGAIILARHRRSARAQRDLFLELNRSREAAEIESAPIRQSTPIRRWFARRFLGHDLIVGDLVEIRSWPEIQETLDAQGCLEQLPFMPEMLAMCGKRAYVFRCVHRIFDYRKSRKMRHMSGGVLLVGAVCDGSNHGGCNATCHTIWKAVWLRRVDRTKDATKAQVSSARSDLSKQASLMQFGTQTLCYTCQLTQLHAASEPIGNRSFVNFLRPLIAGNVTPAAFFVGWLTYIFNALQHQRAGDSFPSFEPATQCVATNQEPSLQAGDHVVVRSSSEIRATLNDQLVHRGMGFEVDMLKHCGRQYRVQTEVKRVIDIVTGEMRIMKTPAYILRDVHFSGERQLFNAQYEPLFWRAEWLQKAEGLPPGVATESQDSELDVLMVRHD